MELFNELIGKRVQICVIFFISRWCSQAQILFVERSKKAASHTTRKFPKQPEEIRSYF
jgi:hypothetical protein